MSGLKELQRKWREHAAYDREADSKYWTRQLRPDWKAEMDCADALSPHIEREERDLELIDRLLSALQGYPSSEEGFPWLIQEARKRLEEV